MSCAVVAALTARGRSAFENDLAVAPAIERYLEVIGEAANSMSDAACRRYPDVPWQEIRATRILLTHHYHRVDLNQVSIMATVDVPQLLEQLCPSSRGDG